MTKSPLSVVRQQYRAGNPFAILFVWVGTPTLAVVILVAGSKATSAFGLFG